MRSGWNVPSDATITGLRIDVSAGDRVTEGAFAVQHVEVTGFAPTPPPVRIGFVLDSEPVSLHREAGTATAFTGDVALKRGQHTVSTLWKPNALVSTLTLERGSPAHLAAPLLGKVSFLSPSLLAVPIDGSERSMVLLSQRYAVGWAATVLHVDPRKTARSELWNKLTSPHERLPHVRANGMLNAWLFPGGHGWLLFGYVPSAFERSDALLSAILFAIELIAIYLATRLASAQRRR